MSQISGRAAAARENARHSDGKFGSYRLADAGTDASLDVVSSELAESRVSSVAQHMAAAQERATRCGLGDLKGRNVTQPAPIRIGQITFSREMTDRITADHDPSYSKGDPITLYPAGRLGDEILVVGDGWHRLAEAIERGDEEILAVIEPLGEQTYDPAPDEVYPEDYCPTCHLPVLYYGCNSEICRSGRAPSDAPECAECGNPSDWLGCTEDECRSQE